MCGENCFNAHNNFRLFHSDGGMDVLRKLAVRFYNYSPRDNLLLLRKKLAALAGSSSPRNEMLDELIQLKTFPLILSRALDRLPHEQIVLLGYHGEIPPSERKKVISARAWEWGFPLTGAGDVAQIICNVPKTETQWEVLRSVRAPNVFTIGEIVGPFSLITFLMKKLNYFFDNPDEVMPYYLGKKFFGPLQELDSLFPIRGKRVIEFGPLDGYQTLGLAHLGADVTSIEARAENVMKTRAALDATGMPGSVHMDDFHNVDATRYGRFDLAFAHGVYYHSIVPFLFLHNLISLSDSIFVGGYCATDDLPKDPWRELIHEGKAYRSKPYLEATDHHTAGINHLGYFFDTDSLMRFFRDRGFRVQLISERYSKETAGRYLQFLATR
jgi:hypothetical protein